MRTIILAAGKGERLRPHTEDRPKCMVPLAGKPMLTRQLEVMRSCGIDDNIAIIGGYQADKIQAEGTRLYINPRFAVTNMVTTFFCALEHMRPGEDLLVSYGDIVYEEKTLRAVLAGTAAINIAADKEWKRLWELRMENPLADAETFKMGPDRKILELGKKPKSYDEVQGQYIGLFRIRGDQVSAVIDAYERMDRTRTYDGKDFDNMYMTSFLQHLIDSGMDVKACLIENGWLEVDTTSELRAYEGLAKEGRLSSYCRLS